jgi:hypothetical protein
MRGPGDAGGDAGALGVDVAVDDPGPEHAARRNTHETIERRMRFVFVGEALASRRTR